MPVVHSFDPPERFVVGTVGEPGARAFFLQARSGPRMVSVACEKQHVAALAERIDELLDEVMRSSTTVVPAVAPWDMDDNDPLEQPIEEEFQVGTLTLSWDPGDERVVIEVLPLTEVTLVDPEESVTGEEIAALAEAEDEPEELVIVRMPPAAARSFVKRARQVIGAGRPDCPFCGRPVDPQGHLCVRANGFKRRDPSGE
ncbi:DUF3090 domain-containing protein [Nocardioides insulae]|uniref:DUF3090 domain-containing protein n=1 Tax=Nocardioides insulae TaxID=394734 RepID=UPI00041EAE88|nr:DUF3090 domain-containing protein [Nocardioides insulae]